MVSTVSPLNLNITPYKCVTYKIYYTSTWYANNPLLIIVCIFSALPPFARIAVLVAAVIVVASFFLTHFIRVYIFLFAFFSLSFFSSFVDLCLRYFMTYISSRFAPLSYGLKLENAYIRFNWKIRIHKNIRCMFIEFLSGWVLYALYTLNKMK